MIKLQDLLKSNEFLLCGGRTLRDVEEQAAVLHPHYLGHLNHFLASLMFVCAKVDARERHCSLFVVTWSCHGHRASLWRTDPLVKDWASAGFTDCWDTENILDIRLNLHKDISRYSWHFKFKFNSNFNNNRWTLGLWSVGGGYILDTWSCHKHWDSPFLPSSQIMSVLNLDLLDSEDIFSILDAKDIWDFLDILETWSCHGHWESQQGLLLCQIHILSGYVNMLDYLDRDISRYSRHRETWSCHGHRESRQRTAPLLRSPIIEATTTTSILSSS